MVLEEQLVCLVLSDFRYSGLPEHWPRKQAPEILVTERFCDTNEFQWTKEKVQLRAEELGKVTSQGAVFFVPCLSHCSEWQWEI